MTIHRLLATRLDVVSPDRLQKNVQIASQPNWKYFANTREQEEARKRNGSSKSKVENEITHSIFSVFKWP